MRHIKIAPSMISSDFGCLAEQIRRTERGGADMIHFDVMDGHFVPNITIGAGVIKSVRSETKLPFIAHLMIENPDLYLEDFVDAGCEYITVHAEACKHLHRTVVRIRELGSIPGIALNPSTPVSTIEHVIGEAGLILIMTVNPGFSGQKFIRNAVPKITAVRKTIDVLKLDAELEVDGGINPETAPIAARAGASILVAASAVFNPSGSIEENIAKLRKSAEA